MNLYLNRISLYRVQHYVADYGHFNRFCSMAHSGLYGKGADLD